MNSLLNQTNLNDGPGPKVVKVCSQSGPNPNPKSPLKDISNTIGIATKMRPKPGKSPKTNTKGELVTVRVKKHNQKRFLPPHDEADTQSQKKRVVSPHVLPSPETILVVAVPQPYHIQ